MPGGKCVFNSEWLAKEEYKDFLLSVADSRHEARCSLCSKVIDVSNMGETAIKSHITGKKYKQLAKSEKKKIVLSNFYSVENRNTETSSQPRTSYSVQNEIPVPVLNLDQAINLNSLTTKAEILWTLKVLHSHYSYKFCEKVNFLFKAMFSDSEIAKNFNCGEKKTAYLSIFGIAPYFSSLLKSRVKDESNYVLLFDETGHVNESDCDTILKEYSQFITDFNSMDTITKFKHCISDNFDPIVDRLDVFYYEFLSDSHYPNLWNVIRLLLLLSHGQATVERGFSVNKNLLIENLGNQTIVAKRIINDHLRFIGGLEKVIISKELMVSAAGAHQKYLAYLKEQKLCTVNKVKGEKRKMLTKNVDDLMKKKRRLEDDIQELNKASGDFSDQAEEKCDLVFISKANALRRRAKEKMFELKICEEELNNANIFLKSV